MMSLISILRIMCRYLNQIVPVVTLTLKKKEEYWNYFINFVRSELQSASEDVGSKLAGIYYVI